MNERFVLEQMPPQAHDEHVARYRYAAQFVGGRDVLDVACGTGYGSRMLAEAGARSVVGLDVSAEALASAQAQGPLPNLVFRQDDAQRLATIPDASIDVVVSFETIEHLPDDREYLMQVHRVLRPGGQYIMSTPDRRPGSMLYLIRRRPGNPFHVREYNQRELRQLLQEKFEIVDWFGQGFVNPILCLWPIQAVIKGTCFALKRFGAQRLTQRLYYLGSGTAVESPGNRLCPIPRYWLVHCRKP